jgi:hypothetical protein
MPAKEEEMINAIKELVKKIGGSVADKVLCADIFYYSAREPLKEIIFKTGQDPASLIEILAGIEYDPVYGHQHLDGRVWTKDLTTLTRVKYNGEWWEEYPLFPIPTRLVTKPWAMVKYMGEDFLVNEDEDQIIPMRIHNILQLCDHGAIMTLYEQAAMNIAAKR